MTGENVGYVRVSTLIQNTARQLDGIPLHRVFEDKASGKNTDRPQLTACLAHLRDGDTLHVHSMDRLCRNLDDLRRIVKELTGRGVVVKFHKENLMFTGEDISDVEPASEYAWSVCRVRKEHHSGASTGRYSNRQE